MNFKNWLTLTIRVEDFNEVVKRPEFIKKLRKLTLHSGSGMNYELDHLTEACNTRRVQCKVLSAYRKGMLVGWALLSREPTDYYFQNSPKGFDSTYGTLFEVYVHHEHRRQGIASELLRVAKRKANSSRLCVCPWNVSSTNFYDKFRHFGYRIM
jgi:ribosomal protein S18 acetylase RimI-like enzyme